MIRRRRPLARAAMVGEVDNGIASREQWSDIFVSTAENISDLGTLDLVPVAVGRPNVNEP